MPDGITESFYISAFQQHPDIFFQDWENYNKYDVAIFIASHPNLKESIRKAQKQNPKILIGLLEPKGDWSIPFIKQADFLIIDSIEKKDYVLNFHKSVFVYFQYPNLKPIKKVHKNKDKIIIGYHGNKVHFAEMFPNIIQALEELGKKYPIELWAMYNIKKLGKLKNNLPKNVYVRHIQWSLDNYYKEIAQSDIGIVPNCMPIFAPRLVKNLFGVSKSFFLEKPEDYLLRFKIPSNPNRLITFAILNIPVVADLYPSALSLIQDGKSGFITHSTGGWYSNLERLIESPKLRQKLADNLYESIKDEINFDFQNKKLFLFLKNLPNDRNPLPHFSRSFMKKRYIKFRYNIYKDQINSQLMRIKKFYNKTDLI